MTSEETSRADQVEFARRIALNLLERRQRSEGELRAALARKNVPQDIIDELMTRFTEVQLIDDAAFAEALVTTRVQVERRGRTRIRQELRTKGVDQEIIDEALSGLDVEDEWEAARTFASRRAKSLVGLDPLKAQRRLMGALARRGFSPSIVTQVTRETLGAQD